MNAPTLRHRAPPSAFRGALAPLACAAALAAGCAGGGDAGPAPDPLRIEPAHATVATGQTLALALRPAGARGTWSVRPAGCGTVAADGMFTAGDQPAACAVTAVVDLDLRYTATATIVVLDAPPPPGSPELVQASGAIQLDAAAELENVAIVGELTPAGEAGDAGARVRHGFTPSLETD